MFGLRTKTSHDRSRFGPARARAGDSRRRSPRRAGHADEASVPGGLCAADRRHGLLLGRRARVLAGARGLHDGGRIRRRLHAQPHLRGGLQRAHRPHRGGAGGVRSRQDLIRAAAPACSGRITTRRRECARATTSGPSTARRSCWTPRAHRQAGGLAGAYAERLRAAGYREITTEIAPAGHVLLRRGLPPAVPAQEPVGVLRARRHRRQLPGRARRGQSAPPRSGRAEPPRPPTVSRRQPPAGS